MNKKVLDLMAALRVSIRANVRIGLQTHEAQDATARMMALMDELESELTRGGE